MKWRKMSRVHICDSCGIQIDDEAFSFEVNFIVRKAGGGGVLPHGIVNVEWDQREENGELCDECAEPIIEELNEIL